MNEDRASRYHRLRRRSVVLWILATAVALVVVAVSGVADAMGGGGPQSSLLSVARAALLLGLLAQLLALPFVVYRVVLDRRYGLSTASLSWVLGDRAKSAAILLALGVALAELIYFTLRRWPEWWWLVSGAALIGLLVALSAIAPRLLLPRKSRRTPLDRAGLGERLMSLSARAGVPLLEVCRWQPAGIRSRATAAVAGIGSTRRIFVSNRLLDEYTDDEIEVVIAHELAHHVHHDIPRTIAAEGVQIVAALYVAARALDVVSKGSGHSAADVAGLPWLLLAAGGAWIAGTPIRNAVSRAHERRADRFALAATGKPAPFRSALRRLAAQNLAELRPPRLAVWFFHRHPPVQERIDAADAGCGDRQICLSPPPNGAGAPPEGRASAGFPESTRE